MASSSSEQIPNPQSLPDPRDIKVNPYGVELKSNLQETTETEPTPNQIWGPFYVLGAPFRCKVSPPWAKGTPLVVSGYVFGLDTKKSIPSAVIDLWHASPEGTYDYREGLDGNGKTPYIVDRINTRGLSDTYYYRAKTMTDHNGRYEYETIRPPPYANYFRNSMRCPHIHYYVQARGYKPVITQIYLEGSEYNDTDLLILDRLTMKLKQCSHKYPDGTEYLYLESTMNIYLEPETNLQESTAVHGK